MEPGWGRQAFAEFLGVTAFILFGAGSVAATATSEPGVALLIRSLAHGLAIAVLVSAFAPISGGHLNPAVTFGLLVVRRIRVSKAVLFIVAQLIGSVVGALLVVAFFPGILTSLPELGAPDLAPVISGPQNIGAGIFIEFTLTFVLVLVVFATAVDPRGAAKQFAGLAIGLAVTLGWLIGGDLTGAAMNPARWFGPALLAALFNPAVYGTRFFTNSPVYVLGPLLGGGLAAFLYAVAFLQREKPTA